MQDRELLTNDIPGDWMVEVRPVVDANGDEIFHATLFYDQMKRGMFDGEGWGPTVVQAIFAAAGDAEEDRR